MKRATFFFQTNQIAMSYSGLGWKKNVQLTQIRVAGSFRSLLAGLKRSRDLEADSSALGSALLACFAKGLCEFQEHPERFVTSPGEKPRACPLARLQAVRGNEATNRRHEVLQLGKLESELVSLLDGEHDRVKLIEELTLLATKRTLNVSVDDQVVADPTEIRRIMAIALEGALQRLARAAI